MNNIKRFLKTIVILSLCLTFIIVLSACNKQLSDELEFKQVLAVTNDISDKAITTNLDFSIILYDANGEPIKITQQILLERVQKEGAIYIKGDINTSEYYFPDKSALKLIIASALLTMPTEFGKYLNQKAEATFEIGYHDGSINARGDLYDKKATPDFKFSFKGNEFDLFFGANYADILAEQQDMKIELFKDIDPIEQVMQLFLPSYDYETAQNELGNTLSKGSSQYQYKFSIPSASLYDLVMQQVNEAYDEAIRVFEQDDEQEYLEAIQKIYSHIDLLQKWVVIEDIVYSATADSYGKLTSSNFGSKVTLRVPDADVLLILSELDIFSTEEISQALTLMHSFITSPNGVKDVFEISFLINISESYNYSPEIDLDSEIFTPISTPLEQRTVIVRSEDEDGQFHWDIEDNDTEED